MYLQNIFKCDSGSLILNFYWNTVCIIFNDIEEVSYFQYLFH